MVKTVSSDADYEALAEFRFTLREFMAFSEGRAAEFGLSPQQHQALLIIRAAAAETATIGYVAARLLLKPHSASGLIDRLENFGLVERQVSSRDRRQSLLILTDKATTLLAALSSTHQEEIRRLRPMLVELLARIDGGE